MFLYKLFLHSKYPIDDFVGDIKALSTVNGFPEPHLLTILS